MPLKSLELYNFKSYKGTQVIEFGDSPFICVIGPNGAGKSNLMDAISFVLGIRSLHLRSSQLRDLVYRGRATQSQDDDAMDVDEPSLTQGHDGPQARTAHVTAIYEDDKGKLWRFRRSIAASGQSSYTLNSNDITWKQYNAQLEKFNILTKAKNFLVFQGDVEGIASQDSGALAKLIDRVSGSIDHAAAYEAAKQEQDKASEASNANYAKKKSMLTEVKHFREQQEEIRQWERLQDNKDALIKRHMLWRLYHLTQEINAHTEQVEAAASKLTDLRDQMKRDETQLQDARQEQAQAQLQLKKREKAAKLAERAYEEKKPELVSIDAQIEHTDKKLENVNATADRVARDETRQADNLRVLHDGANDIEERMEAAAEAQRQKSRTAGKILSGKDLEEYQTLRSDANLTVVSERRQVEALQRDEKTQRDALASVEDKLQEEERRSTILEQDITRYTNRQTETQTHIDELSEERDRVKARIDQAVAERQRINIKETELNEKLQDVFGKLLSAGADKRESEREMKMKDVINNLKRIFPGVHGRVIDLCKPTARKYDTAVMTILGRNTDAIVVEQESVAIDCIEYMRNQRAGQATFIPLDTIQARPVQEKYRNFTRGARLAIDCIEYEPAVERAMQHACGSSLICETIDIAKYICYEKNQEVKAVTLDGTIIHKSGLITGGQSSSNARRFNDSDVKNLQTARDTYMQQLAELHKNKPSEKDDDALLADLARLDANLGVAAESLTAVETRLHDLQAELDYLKRDMAKSIPDRNKKRQTLDATQKKIADLLDVVHAADDKVFQAFCTKIGVRDIREYEDVQLKMAKEESEAMEKYTAQQARIKHQINFETAQLKSTQDRLTSLRSTADRARRKLEELAAQKQTVQTELDDLLKAAEKVRSKVEKATEAHDAALAKVDNLRDKARQTSRSLDKAIREIATWNDEITKSASDRHAIYKRCRLEEVDLPLKTGNLNKVPLEEVEDDEMDVDEDKTQEPVVANDYGIEPDFDDLEEEDLENGDEEVGREFEEQIAHMKAELEKNVPNLKAIDRLNDVEGELEDTEREVEDTRRRTRTAKETFLDLKKKRCDLFNAAYQHMSNCIDSIYKDLTKTDSKGTGGVAFLSLEDAQEPYLSGVKYNVMPPGKPFIEMDQLSGGEKTMAALALLFAIHSFHPAPFFVLDEVDAALDSTNVSKLARYVRSQAEKDVQFLIISLKPDLYQHADGLVGVYRDQDDNTSKSLTLDLRQYAE